MSGYTTDSLCPAAVQLDMHATCDGYIDCHFDGVYNHVGDKSLATSVRIVNICGKTHPEGNKHMLRSILKAGTRSMSWGPIPNKKEEVSHSPAFTSLC